jgi:hypothetical protein
MLVENRRMSQVQDAGRKVNYTGLPCVLSRKLPQHEELEQTNN